MSAGSGTHELVAAVLSAMYLLTQVPTIAMSCHLPSTLSDRGDASTDFEITVGNVKYLLIESQKNFLQCADFDNDNGHILVLVYTIGPNDPIEKSALRKFQVSTLNRDDVYQPDFASKMVFYGFSEKGTLLDPDTLAELRPWNVKKKSDPARAARTYAKLGRPQALCLFKGQNMAAVESLS
ncbi:hypothetical protein ARSEF1564_003494 [Beauveria bassiana]